MKTNIWIAACAALLSMAAAPARAHHSFAAVYDSKRMISATGVVTSFRLVNPHAMLTLDVTDEAGKVVQWTVELDGRLNLTVHGWTPETIRVGERVTISGNPSHTGSPRMAFMMLQREDGSQLMRPGVERFISLEQERQQRAQQRPQADETASGK